MSLFIELKRRNVFRVGIAYVVVGWLVLQVADVVLNNIEAPDWVFQAILLLLGIGLPLVLIFAWAFELTPEGLKREAEVDRSASITPTTGRKLDRAIIVVLVIALGYFALDKFWLQPGSVRDSASAGPEQAEAQGPETIAVLPFLDMSPAGDSEYFSDGLTEELLNILAKIKELQVAGRTSSFAFKGRNEDLREIGEKLNVRSILEGSVRKNETGQRVRITAQLVNVENGYHLWSETYDRELKDIFAIQDEIAHQVAAALRITLLGEDEARLTARATTGLSAYETYLQALKEYNDYSYASLRKAEELFQQSIAQDPEYVPAQVGLARTLHELNTTGALSREEKNARSRPLLDSILARDPANSEAHVLMAMMLRGERDFEGTRRELDLALNADPRNTEALKEMGRLVFDRGDTRTGMEYLREAERLDPYSISVLWDLCFTNALMLKPDIANTYCTRIGEVQPGNPMRYYGPSMAAQFSGDLANAVYFNQKAMELDPDDHELPAMQVVFWLNMGDLERAEAMMEQADRLGANETFTVAARVEMLHFREQYGMAGDLARRALQSGLENRAGMKYRIENMFVAAMVDSDRINVALDYYRDLLPGAFEQPLQITVDGPERSRDLIMIAMLLHRQEPGSAHAGELLAIAEARITTLDGLTLPWARSIQLARIAAIRGQREQALDLIQAAVDQKMRASWRISLEVAVEFRELHDEPRYREMIAEIEADMERQREKAYELLEAGP